MISIFANRYQRAGFDIVVTMVTDKRFDGLACFGLELNLVENDERFALLQLDVINELEPEKDIVEVGYIVKQIQDFLRALGEVNEDVGVILALGKLFNDGGFADTTRTLYQKG